MLSTHPSEEFCKCYLAYFFVQVHDDPQKVLEWSLVVFHIVEEKKEIVINLGLD
jgi:hypothetical protein